MSETPFYIVAQDVVVFELISNNAAVSIRWWVGKERFDAEFPADTEVHFRQGSISANKDILTPPEPVEA